MIYLRSLPINLNTLPNTLEHALLPNISMTDIPQLINYQANISAKLLKVQQLYCCLISEPNKKVAMNFFISIIELLNLLLLNNPIQLFVFCSIYFQEVIIFLFPNELLHQRLIMLRLNFKEVLIYSNPEDSIVQKSFHVRFVIYLVFFSF